MLFYHTSPFTYYYKIINNFKPYHKDAREPSRKESRHTLTTIVTVVDKDVKYIISDRVIKRKGILA